MSNNDAPKPLFLFKQLFHRDLIETLVKKPPEEKIIEKSSRDVIMSIDYERNSHGYRCNEFGNNEDIMILGCSQTFGSGLPEEFLWGTVFANKLNKSYVNLAQEGDGATAQIYKAFKYFEEFGNPKIIVACLPSTRIEMPFILEKFGKHGDSRHGAWTDAEKIGQVFLYNELEKYSKMPHNPEKILPMEFAVFYSFMFIQFLEQYCKSNNITFIWNMWDDYYFLDYLKEVPKVLDNYIDLKFGSFTFNDETGIEKMADRNAEGGSEPIIPICHQELKDHPLFYRAADYNPGILNGHWGIHMHQHIAEDFYNKYIDTITMEKQ